MINRRQWLRGMGIIASGAAQPGRTFAASRKETQKTASPSLSLAEFSPKSMLQVPETHVAHARFPVIDFHTHITRSAKSTRGVSLASDRVYLGTPQELLAVMDSKNVRAMVNLTAGYDKGLGDVISKYDHALQDRFYSFTEPCYERLLETGYPQLQAEAIERAHRQGARGLKILKTLGLYLRENITSGKLVKIDDPRFDPMWDACGQLNMPVAIHVSDPAAFFTPTDRFNERYEELMNHPDWSFYGGDFPSNAELLEARNQSFGKASQDPICRVARGKLRRKPGQCGREPRSVSQHERGYCRPHWRVGKTATNCPEVF